MTPAARYAAAIDVLDHWLDGVPLEKALTGWARGARYAGSKDRAAVRDIVFQAVRCRDSYTALGGALTGRGLTLGVLVAEGDDPALVFTGERFAPVALNDAELAHLAQTDRATTHRMLNLPEWLLPDLQRSLGSALPEIAAVMQTRAPAFLRVNLSRISRSDAQNRLAKEGIETHPHDLAATALEVISNPRRVAQSQAYLTGLVELQDAASQAVCADLSVPEGARILDYCAGGGGKALALADMSDAEIFAHDIQPSRMRDIPARAARAGVEVQQISPVEIARAAPFDLVLCDVPCSGSGAWRRAVAGKWSLTRAQLEDVRRRQREILDEVADLTAPGGQLVYVTCSLLLSENIEQIECFAHQNSCFSVDEARQWTPLDGGDGFFRAILRNGTQKS